MEECEDKLATTKMRYNFFFLIFLSFKLNAQITNLDSVSVEYFHKYDIILIGEEHFISATEDVEIKLISLVKNNSSKVCLEAPGDMNITFDIVFNRKDTSKYNFNSFTEHGYKSNLLKFLYRENLIPAAIDILKSEYFLKDEILKIYDSKQMPAHIREDIKLFSEIKSLKPPTRYKNMKKYINFIESINENRQLHADILAADSTKVFEYFDALNAMLYSENDFGNDGPTMTNYREEFMFKMLAKEVNNKANSKVISFNGNAHINLDNKSKWIRDKKFISLGARLKAAYPDKNIASIYLMYRQKDLYFKGSCPDEYDFIIQNTQSDKQYIIEINEQNMPFRKLIGKYTHVVVY